VVDENGTVVPNAEHDIRFKIKGNAELVGQNPISAEAGIASILLRAGDELGTVTITATNDELEPATEEIITE